MKISINYLEGSNRNPFVIGIPEGLGWYDEESVLVNDQFILVVKYSPSYYIPSWLFTHYNIKHGNSLECNLSKITTADTQKAKRIHLSSITSTPWIPTTHGMANNNIKKSSIYLESKGWLESLSDDFTNQLILKDTKIGIHRQDSFAICNVRQVWINDKQGNNVECQTDEPVMVDENTIFHFDTPLECNTSLQVKKWKLPHYNSHLSEEAKILSDALNTFLFNQNSHQKVGVNIQPGIHVNGPVGSGRKTLVHHVVTEIIRVPLFYFHISELTAFQRYQESIGRDDGINPLSKLIEILMLSTPCVLLFDGLDILNSDFNWKDVNRFSLADTIVGELKKLENQLVGIIGISIDSSKLPNNLQQSRTTNSVFGHQIEISQLGFAERKNMIESILKNSDSLGLDNNRDFIVQYLAMNCINCNARDLSRIVNLVAMTNFNDSMDSITEKLNAIHLSSTASLESDLNALHLSGNQTPPKDNGSSNSTLTQSRIEEIVKSNMNNHSNQFTSSKPNVLWTDVAGYPQLKKKLEQLIRWPIEHPETYRKLGVKPPSGILLHGPSGCGKTMLVHAIANEIPISFISVKSHQIYSKYLGESERMIRLLFQQANKSKPCIIFLDDIDSIGTRREWSEDGAGGVNERVLSSLLNEMDGVGNRDGIIVIACTNQCQNLDDALTRPGRLDIHLKVSIPTTQDRFDILNHLCKKSNVDLSDDVLQTLVDKTFNFTGADLNALLREAGILAMLESISHPKIQIHHLMKALKGVISENREGWWKY